jgi:hypothetical protein
MPVAKTPRSGSRTKALNLWFGRRAPTTPITLVWAALQDAIADARCGGPHPDSCTSGGGRS